MPSPRPTENEVWTKYEEYLGVYSVHLQLYFAWRRWHRYRESYYTHVYVPGWIECDDDCEGPLDSGKALRRRSKKKEAKEEEVKADEDYRYRCVGRQRL